MGNTEGRDRQCQTSAGCFQLDVAARGSVGIWCARARQGQGHWKRDCRHNEANLKPKDKSKGKEGKDKNSANTQQQANKGKKSVKCWNAQVHVAKDCPKKKHSLSAVGSQAPASSGAAGETTLIGFFLNAEEEAEPNSPESKTAGVLVTGTDSGAARSVVPAGERFLVTPSTATARLVA